MKRTEASSEIGRRMCRVCKLANLRIDSRFNQQVAGQQRRLIGVYASTQKWPWEISMLELSASVGRTGRIAWAIIKTVATNDDPLRRFWPSATVKFHFQDLYKALELILREREIVIEKLA